jgi:hypothetical protein
MSPSWEFTSLCGSHINQPTTGVGLHEGEEVFQSIKIILRNMDLLPQKISRNWRISFLKQNWSPGICIEAEVQWVLLFTTHVSTYFQWHAHQQRRQWHYYGSVFLLRGDSWATPTPVFCKMKLYFCTVPPVFRRRLIDTHTHTHTHTRTHILRNTWAHRGLCEALNTKWPQFEKCHTITVMRFFTQWF